MRAHYLSSLGVQETYVLKDDSLHHLVNVIRIEASERLFLLNGQGLGVVTEVESISKKELRLRFLQETIFRRNFEHDVAIGIPKREALELCLKQATELGFRNIYLIRSDYSQQRLPEFDRLEKLLISALEQSNSGFLPKIVETTWDLVPWETYGESLLLDSQTSGASNPLSKVLALPRLLVVGPEGGFSSQELAFLHARDKMRVVNLPTPILRTPTALAAGAGVMMLSLLK